MKKPILFLALCILCCSEERPYDSFQPFAKILQQSGFSRSILSPQKRIYGFSPSTSRISIMDPSSLEEVQSYQLDSAYTQAAVFDGFEVVAAFHATQLEILAAGSSKKFALQEWQHWDLASNSIAMVFSSLSGSEINLIRNKGNGLWQEATLKTNPNPEGTLQIAQLSTDGNKILSFTPTSGEYAVFQANTSAEDIPINSRISCKVEPIAHDPWTAAYYDGEEDLLILGNEAGSIYVVDTTKEQCSPLHEIPKLQLKAQKRVLSISKRADNTYLASTVDTGFSILQIHAQSIQQEEEIPVSCSYPVASLAISNTEIGFICLEVKKTVEVVEDEIVANSTYSTSTLEIYDQQKKNRSFSMKVDLDTHTTLSWDPDLRKLFHLEDNSLGILNIWDMDTGLHTQKKGIFIKDFLKKI